MLHGSKIGQPTSRVCNPRLRLGWQLTRDMDCPSFFLPRCAPTFPPAVAGMRHFRPGARKIVYYAPREEKTWTVHSSCKLPPEPKARVANTSCGLANFIPVVRILFFAIPGPKTPHSRFGAGRECGTFGQGVAKSTLSPAI